MSSHIQIIILNLRNDGEKSPVILIFLSYTSFPASASHSYDGARPAGMLSNNK